MSKELSMFRAYLMRVLYLLTFLGVGYSVWPEIISRGELWRPLDGVAFSFWAAYSALMGLGIRYPQQMLPLLILQLFYKSVWLIAVAFPLWSAGRLDSGATEMLTVFSIAVVADLVVIPWPYVLENYVKKPGDGWR